MKKQTAFFIIGIIFLFLAIFCITLLPYILKKYTLIKVQEYMFSEMEFLLLLLSAFCYTFSLKYYKAQILSILIALFCFLMFCKINQILF